MLELIVAGRPEFRSMLGSRPQTASPVRVPSAEVIDSIHGREFDKVKVLIRGTP